MTGSAGQRRVPSSYLASLRVPLLPIYEQRRIAAILDKAETVRERRLRTLEFQDKLIESLFMRHFVRSKGTPEKWQFTDVQSIAKPEAGSIRTGPFGSQLLHSEFTNDGIAVLGIDNAVTNEFRWGELRYISAEKYAQLKRYTVLPGDVLITIMGTCGRCAIVPDDIPTAINTKHLCCITLNHDICLPRYLHDYFLMHPIARRYLAQTAKGAIMSGLNMEIIKNVPVLVPPIELQREYAREIAVILKQRDQTEAASRKMHILLASVQSCFL